MASRFSNERQDEDERKPWEKITRFVALKDVLFCPPVNSIDREVLDPDWIENVKSSLKLLGGFSYDAERKFLNDNSSLKFIDKNFIPDEPKEVSMDISVFEEQACSYDGSPMLNFLDFLKWIHCNREKVQRNFILYKDVENHLGPDFVFQKAVLHRMALTAYTKNEIKFYASCVNETVYVANNITLDMLLIPDAVSNWSHKFKQYMYGEDLSKSSDPNGGYRAVISAEVGPFQLLYCASTDGVNPDLYKEEFEDMSAFVKLATSATLDIPDHYFITKSCLHYYLNSLFTSTPTTIVGFRKPKSPIVNILKAYTQEDLFTMLKTHYDPVKCLYYVINILYFVKEKTETEPGAIFSFKKESMSNEITCTREDEKIGCILPSWYTKDSV